MSILCFEKPLVSNPLRKEGQVPPKYFQLPKESTFGKSWKPAFTPFPSNDLKSVIDEMIHGLQNFQFKSANLLFYNINIEKIAFSYDHSRFEDLVHLGIPRNYNRPLLINLTQS